MPKTKLPLVATTLVAAVALTATIGANAFAQSVTESEDHEALNGQVAAYTQSTSLDLTDRVLTSEKLIAKIEQLDESHVRPVYVSNLPADEQDLVPGVTVASRD
jgi:hypothetical protein